MGLMGVCVCYRKGLEAASFILFLLKRLSILGSHSAAIISGGEKRKLPMFMETLGNMMKVCAKNPQSLSSMPNQQSFWNLDRSPTWPYLVSKNNWHPENTRKGVSKHHDAHGHCIKDSCMLNLTICLIYPL